MKKISVFLIDSILIASLYLNYFKCYDNAFSRAIILTGLYGWIVITYTTLATFVKSDKSWEEVLKEEKSKWFKIYDRITDYLMIMGLFMNGWNIVLVIFIIFKIKAFNIRKGYRIYDNMKKLSEIAKQEKGE